MVDITTPWMRTNAGWRRFKSLGTSLLETMSARDLLDKAPEASAVVQDAKRYLQGVGADAPRKLAKKYSMGEARARNLRHSGAKARRRKPQAYEYKDIQLAMDTNPVVRLAVLSALFEGVWGPMYVQVEKRMDKAEASDFWNQDAVEERCDIWRDRMAAMEVDTEQIESIVMLLADLGQGKAVNFGDLAFAHAKTGYDPDFH